MNEKANEWHILGRLGAFFAIRLRIASIPLQGDQFFIFMAVNLSFIQFVVWAKPLYST